MRYIYISIIMLSALTLNSCNNHNPNNSETMKPSKVELREVNGEYSLYVDDEPFFVQGAGVDDGDIAALAAHGANSLRTWMDSDVHIPADEVLALAKQHDLKVMMGLPLGRERHGFDYDDPQAVEQQFKKIQEKVMAMKDHPALLGWGIGNELNLRSTNMKVWDAVEQIAAFIHEVDGNHPTTTMLAGIGKKEVDYIRENCPSLDFISIQMYGDIVNLQQRIDEAGYDGPYLVTEWGATGHWEVPATEWNAPIENTSSEKARDIKHRYEKAILGDKSHCLGSYVFLWGQKQERTPTWYGLFTEGNRETEAIDVMEYYWTGKWPENQAPKIIDANLNGLSRYDNIKLDAAEKATLNYNFSDPDNDPLTIRTEILPESTDLKDGGDLEERPESLDMKITNQDLSATSFITPSKPGAYRVFVYAMDNNNHVATVNIPFLIE